ncbi:MAG: sodium/proton-translocating pyrophosphatase [Candidatus Omnitrophica bacterium]|nr:sodium/proton-translocating pyrophosphatase [Candidatus Omnitrophota bacterium]
MIYIYISIIISFIALVFAGIVAFGIKRRKIEDEKAEEISRAIHKGAMAFLNKEYKVLIVFVVVVGIILYFFLSQNIAWAFLCGAIFSALAGNIGMRIATSSNARTAEAAKKSLKDGLKDCFQ